MADDIDLANDLINNEVSRALSKLRQHTNPQQTGSKTCVECDEAMPEARQTMGFKLCVNCANESERRRALFAD